MAKKELTIDDIEVGDKVQILPGGMDVTNGIVAKSGGYYVEGGTLWAEVESITEKWNTGGAFGQPPTVVKVRCSYTGVVVWQVQPKHIAPNIIKANPKPKEETKVKGDTDPPPPVVKDPPVIKKVNPRERVRIEIGDSKVPYAPVRDNDDWTKGANTEGAYPFDDELGKNINKIGYITDSAFTDGSSNISPGWVKNSLFIPDNTSEAALKLRKSLPPAVVTEIERGENIPMYPVYPTSWSNEGRRAEMLNNKPELIQNEYGFPFKPETTDNENQMEATLYDYQIIIDDERLKSPKDKESLGDKLMKARAQFGIPVHGNAQIAKSMKFYSYNRFKIPDKNMAHNKSFTYVFFTRPDLNLLQKIKDGSTYTIVDQIANHTEAALLWKQQPELFKLLTDNKRCGDSNNFNFLLSNQVTSFELTDETLNTNVAGKSWNDFQMKYGDQYIGRAAGEFSCNFTETNEYSIIKLMKLWITYIDNVSRGAWEPSYNLNNIAYTKDRPITYSDSHVFTKTLDYACSAYVFKCAADGETVLYWSAYKGVFPVNTAANTLSWDISNSPGDGPKPSIRFAYSWKCDMNPISLIEFNTAGNVDNTVTKYQQSWDPNEGATARPYVGAPYIQMDLGIPSLTPDGVGIYKDTTIRLKFRPDTNPSHADNILYRGVYKHPVKDENQTETK